MKSFTGVQTRQALKLNLGCLKLMYTSLLDVDAHAGNIFLNGVKEAAGRNAD